MSTPEFPPAQPPATPSNLAGWGTRAIGWLIDYLPMIILQAVAYPSSVLRYLVGVIGLLYLLYLGHLDGVTGQTPGKAIMGTRVVNIEGDVVGSGNGIVRKIAHFLDSLICGLGWLLPIVDAKRQTIADKVMSTYVVEGVEKKNFAVDLWMPPKA